MRKPAIRDGTGRNGTDGRDGRTGRTGRDGRDGMYAWGRLNGERCSLLHRTSTGRICWPADPSVPEPPEGRFRAIQHYLVRPNTAEHPLLHGLFGAKGTEKMLSYTTLVHGDETGRTD